MRYSTLVFLGACSYGVLSTFVKLAYGAGFTVDEVTGSQALLGLLMQAILCFSLLSTRTKMRLFPRTFNQWLLLMAVGSMAGLTGILYYTSLQYVEASVAVVLLFQFTWIGVLLGCIMERRWPQKAEVAGLILLLIGTLLASGFTVDSVRNISRLGLVFGLLSAVTYTIFLVFSGRVAVATSPVVRSTIMQAGAVVLICTVYPPTFLVTGELFHGLLTWGILIALFGGVIPTLFFAIGVPKTGASLASIIGAAELPMAVLMSSVALGEAVSGSQWIGVAVILIGIAFPELVRKRARIRHV